MEALESVSRFLGWLGSARVEYQYIIFVIFMFACFGAYMMTLLIHFWMTHREEENESLDAIAMDRDKLKPQQLNR